MIRELLLRLRKIDAFHIDTKYFPESTRRLIPTEMMLRFGALALGIKGGEYINIGLLDPRRLEARDAIGNLVRREGKRPHFYAIDPSGFVSVLNTHYGLDSSKLGSVKMLDDTLRVHLAT